MDIALQSQNRDSKIKMANYALLLLKMLEQ